MKEYWPIATVKEKDGSIRTQATYDSCNNIRDALGVITAWSEFYHYDIIEAWIDLKNGKHSERIEADHVWVAHTDEWTTIGDPYKKEEGENNNVRIL